MDLGTTIGHGSWNDTTNFNIPIELQYSVADVLYVIVSVLAKFFSVHGYFPVKTHKFSSDRNGGHKLFKTSCSVRVFTTNKRDEIRSNTNIVGGYEN